MDEGPFIQVDGAPMDSGEAPIMESGRLMIPLRSVVGLLGGVIHWYPDDQQVVGFRGAHGFDLVIGAQRAYLSDGSIYALDVPAFIVGGRTYVPLRFVSEAMGCQVRWDEVSRTAYITTPPIDTKAEVEAVAGPTLIQVSTDLGTGSGFFYSKDGQAITVAGLVQGVSWIQVTTADGGVYGADLLIADSVTNLAKLRVKRPPDDSAPVFRYFDDATGVASGDRVFVFGSAQVVADTVLEASVSAKIEGDEPTGGHGVIGRYDLDAPISAAYSGGPLVKENGALIGVVVAPGDGGPSGAYAVPIEYVFAMQNR